MKTANTKKTSTNKKFKKLVDILKKAGLPILAIYVILEVAHAAELDSDIFANSDSEVFRLLNKLFGNTPVATSVRPTTEIQSVAEPVDVVAGFEEADSETAPEPEKSELEEEDANEVSDLEVTNPDEHLNSDDVELPADDDSQPIDDTSAENPKEEPKEDEFAVEGDTAEDSSAASESGGAPGDAAAEVNAEEEGGFMDKLPFLLSAGAGGAGLMGSGGGSSGSSDEKPQVEDPLPDPDFIPVANADASFASYDDDNNLALNSDGSLALKDGDGKAFTNVLDNDTDLDGDGLTLVGFEDKDSNFIEATDNGDGTFSFTTDDGYEITYSADGNVSVKPPADLSGLPTSDSFTYSFYSIVEDADGDRSKALGEFSFVVNGDSRNTPADDAPYSLGEVQVDMSESGSLEGIQVANVGDVDDANYEGKPVEFNLFDLKMSETGLVGDKVFVDPEGQPLTLDSVTLKSISFAGNLKEDLHADLQDFLDGWSTAVDESGVLKNYADKTEALLDGYYGAYSIDANGDVHFFPNEIFEKLADHDVEFNIGFNYTDGTTVAQSSSLTLRINGTDQAATLKLDDRDVDGDYSFTMMIPGAGTAVIEKIAAVDNIEVDDPDTVIYAVEVTLARAGDPAPALDAEEFLDLELTDSGLEAIFEITTDDADKLIIKAIDGVNPTEQEIKDLLALIEYQNNSGNQSTAGARDIHVDLYKDRDTSDSNNIIASSDATITLQDIELDLNGPDKSGANREVTFAGNSVALVSEMVKVKDVAAGVGYNEVVIGFDPTLFADALADNTAGSAEGLRLQGFTNSGTVYDQAADIKLDAGVTDLLIKLEGSDDVFKVTSSLNDATEEVTITVLTSSDLPLSADQMEAFLKAIDFKSNKPQYEQASDLDFTVKVKDSNDEYSNEADVQIDFASKTKINTDGSDTNSVPALRNAGADLNGDGYNEFVFIDDAGKAHIVFGDADKIKNGFNLADIDLTMMANGFIIDATAGFGTSPNDFPGLLLNGDIRVADVNGDGFDDIIFGTNAATTDEVAQAFVVYGAANQAAWEAFATTVGTTNGEYSAEDFLTNAQGDAFASATQHGAEFVTALGNLDATDQSNKDDFSFAGSDSNTITTVINVNDTVNAQVEIKSETTVGTEGSTVIHGLASGLFGDTDHVTDLAVATNDGVYLLLAEEATTDGGKYFYEGANARLITGTGLTDATVANAGDVNRDGSDNLMIGNAANDKAYVIFDIDSLVDPSLANGSLDHMNPTPDVIYGVAITYTYESSTDANLGKSVLGLGDFDGDGYDDFAISSDEETFILRGRSDTEWEALLNGSADLDLANFIDAEGNFDRELGLALDNLDSDTILTAAGDLNGDGFEDVIQSSMISGESEIIFGYDVAGVIDQLGTQGDDSLAAMGVDEGSSEVVAFNGMQGDDTLSVTDGGYNLEMIGASGQDVFDFSAVTKAGDASIKDFQKGWDEIDLDLLDTDPSDKTAGGRYVFSQDGNTAVIEDLTNNFEIRVEGVNIADIQNDDNIV